MGSVNSTGNKLEKALAADLPEHERYFGLENFGNTCYCNSVLQALYFCEPFRKAVLDYAAARRHSTSTITTSSSSSSSTHKTNSSNFQSSNLYPSQPPPPAPTSASSSTSSMNGSIKNAVKGVVAFASSSSPASVSQPPSYVASPPQSSAAKPVANHHDAPPPLAEETMLTALADLFTEIATQKKRTGTVPPKPFVDKLRQENELFSSYMHQDAHEFLNFILNEVVECLRRDEAHRRRRKRQLLLLKRGYDPNGTSDVNGKLHPNGAMHYDRLAKSVEDEPQIKTFVHDLFEGKLANEVRCLCCETVTNRVESFFDLSVDIEQNSSLTACLRSFSSTELLQKQDKFFCDACCSLQEAERRMRIKKLPRILALHLKRFKYVEQLGKYKKLSYRVVFPLELRLFNTSDDCEDPDRMYTLFAVVVHVGSGPNQGHYVSLIKSHGQWLMFDDDCVEPKDECEIQSVYGVTQDNAQSTEAGYILFYEQAPSSST